MKPALALFALAILLAGCPGDDGGMPTPDGPRVASCTCAALGSDFGQAIGTLSSVELPSLVVARDVVPQAISNDPVMRRFGNLLYIINRFGSDNVTIVDSDGWTVVDQFSTGAGSNPQDIAVVGNKAYVAAFASSDLQIWDLTDTSAQAGSIPLSGFLAGAADGTSPEAASIFVRGSQAYVTLQHLENWTSLAPGTVVVVDTSTDETTGSFQLTSKNPFGFLHEAGGRLMVPTVPDLANPDASGCLEAITIGSLPLSDGCFVQNSALGGYVGGFAETNDGSVYAAVVFADYSSEIVKITANGVPDRAITIGSSRNPTQLAYCGATNQLIYNDSRAGGLRVFDLDDATEVTTQALDIGLPPVYQDGLVCWEQ